MTLLTLFDSHKRTAEDDTGSLQKFIQNRREIREARLEAEIIFPVTIEAKLDAQVEVPISYAANLEATLELRTRPHGPLQAEVALPLAVTGTMNPQITRGLKVTGPFMADVLRREARELKITADVDPPGEIDIYKIYKIHKINEAMKKYGHTT